MAAVEAGPLNKPPEAGVVLVPPKSPPGRGVADVEVADVFLAPKRPVEDGVVEVPPKSPAPEVGFEPVFAEEAVAPKGFPDGFCASPAGFWLKRVPPLFDGVALSPELPPTVPNEKDGVPPEPPPKRPPDAGAVLVALFGGALDELGVPKVKDMVASRREAGCVP